MLKKIHKAAKVIEEACGRAEIGIVLGSGLGDFAKTLKDGTSVPYGDIPGFPESTVPGHAGMWHGGKLHGKRVYLMQGRFHFYEGYDLAEVTLPIRVMAELGVKVLILTNAAGGVNLGYKAGDLMQITDFINLAGQNPLRGPNLDTFGPRFPDMTYAYDRDLAALAHQKAGELGIGLHNGVYCWMSGPCYETPAEIRMARILGADAVGMSTVPETIVARHCGMRVLGLSLITNMAAGVLDAPLDHQEVMAMGEKAKGTFSALLDAILKDVNP